MNDGSQTVGSGFCGKCGHPRTSDAVFCEKCGAQFNGGERKASGTVPNDVALSTQTSPSLPSARPPARRQRIRFIIGAAVSLILLVLVYFSPYISAYQLKRAAETNDIDAMKDRVDFPALRESLKDIAHDEIAKAQATESKENLLAASNSLIDAMMTPMNLARLMRGEKFVGTVAEFGNPKPGVGSPGSVGSAMAYQSLNRFAVRLTNLAELNGSVVLALTRSGLGWKLTSIRQLDAQDKAGAPPVQDAAGSPAITHSGTIRLDDTGLRAYAGRVPDEKFWHNVDIIFQGTLIGSGSGGALARESFEASLDRHRFAPCVYDAQTDTITVTWVTTAKQDEGSIDGGLDGVHAVAFHVPSMDAIVATWDDSTDPVEMTFHGQGQMSLSDVNSLTKRDFHSLPTALGQWATALIRQSSSKSVEVKVE